MNNRFVPMKFACMAGIAPGTTLTDQCAAIAAAGCSGVETIIFPETRLDAWIAEMRQALTATALTPVAVVLGGLTLFQRGQLAWVADALEAISEIGASALLTPEYRAQDPLPLFPPFPSPTAEEQANVNRALDSLADHAWRLRVPLLLEPITQFEGRFWRTTETVVHVCNRLATAHPDLDCGVAVDFHNMNVTEADPPGAIAQAGLWVKHVHLADNNRRLPGRGHIDFAPGLHALTQIGYDGWFSFECAVEGDFVAEVHAAIGRLDSLTAAPSASTGAPIAP